MNPALGQALAQADCVLSLGSRLGDTLTRGYELMDPTRPHARVIQIYPDPDELGHPWRPDPGWSPTRARWCGCWPASPSRGAGTTGPPACAPPESWQTPWPTPARCGWRRSSHGFLPTCPEDAIITNGAGNYAAFVHRYYRYRRFLHLQLAPTSGSLGYGLPAAIAAKLARPAQTVVCPCRRRLPAK